MHHQPVAPLTLTPFYFSHHLKLRPAEPGAKKKNHWIHLFNSALLHPLSILLLFKVALALTDGSPTVPLSLIMYRRSSGSTGGRGGEDFGVACVWDGEESYEGLVWIIYRWLVALPLSVRRWHFERERLSAFSTVWCRAGVNEILYRCRPSRQNLGDPSGLMKDRISVWLVSHWKGGFKNSCKRDQKLYSRELNLPCHPIPLKMMPQMSNDTFLNACVIYS